MAKYPKVRGYEAAVFTGGQAGIITDKNFPMLKYLHGKSYENTVKRLEEGIIPIMQGSKESQKKEILQL